MFAVIVYSKKVLAYDHSVMTRENEAFWVTVSDSYNSTSRCHDESKVAGDVKKFSTVEEAVKFAKKWRGHPWWVDSQAYKIVEIKPVYKQVVCGYEVIKEELCRER